jgi:hypothetical protein
MCGADVSNIARVDPGGHQPRVPGLAMALHCAPVWQAS